MKIGQRFNPHRMFTGVFIPDAVYQCVELSAFARLIYGRLSRFKGERGEAYPAATTLAAELGISERQIFDHLQRLEEQGFIEREARPGTSTVYHFLWHRCFEEGSAESRTTTGNEGSAENRTTGSAENRTRVVRNPAYEESQLRESIEESIPPPPFTSFENHSQTDPEADAELEAAVREETSRASRDRQRRREARDRVKAGKREAKRASGREYSDRMRALQATARARENGGVPATISAPEDANQPPSAATAPASPVAPNTALPFAAQEWNRVVTAGPVVEAWTKRDAALNSAAADPDFLEALPRVLETCQLAHQKHPKTKINWLNFRWLLRRKDGATENWYRIASGEMAYLRFSPDGEEQAKPKLRFDAAWADARLKELRAKKAAEANERSA